MAVSTTVLRMAVCVIEKYSAGLLAAVVGDHNRNRRLGHGHGEDCPVLHLHTQSLRV